MPTTSLLGTITATMSVDHLYYVVDADICKS
jgi:hypothetical protein